MDLPATITHLSTHLPGLVAQAAEPAGLLPARWQMALSLGSHIVLACFGVAFPAMICVVHRRGIRRRRRRSRSGWPSGGRRSSAVLFAIGAVSGTILSFEMGLLWPELMRHATATCIGLPFAFEGIAFFLEAIFLGIYLYGWGRMPPRQHRADARPDRLSPASSARSASSRSTPG